MCIYQLLWQKFSARTSFRCLYNHQNTGRRQFVVVAAGVLATTFSAGAVQAAPRGELDASFGEHGRHVLQLQASGHRIGIVQQPADGKILLTGYFLNSEDNGDFAVMRLHPDGTADETFGTNGTAIVDFGGRNDTATELALQPDGKIIVAGWSFFVLEDEAPDSDFALARFNSDGTLDATFGGDGRVTLHLGGGAEYIRGLVLLENGQIVVTGTTDAKRHTDVVFARFAADGTLDTTFGTGSPAGTTVIGISSSRSAYRNDEPYWLTQQPDGKLVACGVSGTDYWDYIGNMLAVRINADGSLDEGFGTDGVSIVAHGKYADACEVMPDGSIVLVGGNSSDLSLARLTSDGIIDRQFGDSGFSTIDIGTWDSARAIILLNDGSLGLIGRTTSSNGAGLVFPADMFFAHVDSGTGLLDPEFGDNGVTIVDFGHSNVAAYSEGYSLVSQANGKLLAVGSAWGWLPNASSVVLARVDMLGVRDSGLVGFGATTAVVNESIGIVEISVRRTGGSSGELSVDFDTVAKTATAPGDFTASFGTLTWADGDMQPKLIQVPVTDDNIDESSEDFTVVLSNSTGGLAASEFLVTIFRNDIAPTPAPKPAGGGGGGAIGFELVYVLMLLGVLVMRRRISSHL